MHAINLKLDQWQIDFLRSDKLILALSGASNTGKSFIARLKILLHCLANANSKCFCTASTYTQTYRTIIEPLKDFLYEHGIEHYAEIHKGEGFIQFINKSRIEIFSSDNLNLRLRSREFSIGFIEEASVLTDELIESIFTESLRRLRPPAVGPYHLIFATNPGLLTSWLHDNIYGVSRADAFTKHLSFKEGYNRDDKDYEEKLLKGSQREIDLFYHGLWGSMEGAAYTLIDGEHIQELHPDSSWQYYISYDYGFSPDKMVYLLCAIHNGIYYIIDELAFNEIPVNRHPGLLRKWMKEYNVLGFTGETAVGAGEVKSMMRDEFKLGYYFTTKERTLGWTTLSDMLETHKLIIGSKCSEVIRSLRSLVWIKGTRGQDTEGSYEDPADAVRYFIRAKFPAQNARLRAS